MTTPTPTAPITAQSLLRELIPVSEQQRKAIDTACDALDALERDLAAAQAELASVREENAALRHKLSDPDPLSQALNEGDGVYRP